MKKSELIEDACLNITCPRCGKTVVYSISDATNIAHCTCGFDFQLTSKDVEAKKNMLATIDLISK